MILRYILLTQFVITMAVSPGSSAAGTFPLNLTFYADPPQPPLICAPKMTLPPVLDGKLDDEAWRRAAALTLTQPSGAPPSQATEVRVCYDDENLYVAFDCQEPEMGRLRATAQLNEDKWPGDCVEVFVDPRRTRQRFYQFVTSHLGAHNDSGPGGDLRWNGQWKTKAGRDKDGWVVELEIPFADFGIERAPHDSIWGFNVTRERMLVSAEVELSTWALIRSFAMVGKYGDIYFGTAEQFAKHRPPIRLQAALDRQVHSKLNRVAQLGVMFTSGKAEGSSLALSLLDAAGKSIREATLGDLKTTRFSMDIPIRELPPAEYRVRVVATDAAGRQSAPVELGFRLEAPSSSPVESGSVSLRPTELVQRRVERWHVRTGVPFPEGALWDADNVALFLRGGEPIPVQATPLATWSKGGSIKWLGLDFPAPLETSREQNVVLRFGPNVTPTRGGSIQVDETDQVITIRTGFAEYVLRKRGFNGLDQATVDGKRLVRTGEKRGPYMTDEDGTIFWASADEESVVEVEEKGPLLTVVRAEGAHVATAGPRKGQTLGRYVARMYFYSDLPYFRLQHTFIITEDTTRTRYADIGFLLPFQGKDYRFGLPLAREEPTSAVGKFEGTIERDSVSLLQRSWDNFVIKTNGRNVERLVEGDKAPGWFGRQGVAIAVRDFWQNYPKELEATRDGLIVHLWPGHGERFFAPEWESGVENAWRLSFAHQGKLLDFNMPDRYYQTALTNEYGFAYQQPDGSWKLANGEGPRKSNAMGLAKMHDMLVVLGEQAEPERLISQCEAFQKNIHWLSDPDWNCSTEVAGPIAPFDPQRFPIPESYYSDGFDYLMRVTWDLNNAYGMFNFGDSFTLIKRYTARQEPSYYRLWAGYHHGRARVPWLLYLRSGDPKYLRWARANSLHLADVDTCHYATPEFETHPVESSRKAVGGMCDYKGIVHWHTGAGVDYNSMTDYLLYDYYLTGNRRAWDVLMEVGPYTVEHGVVVAERHGAGVLSALLDYYKATWDPRALLAFTQQLPNMYHMAAFQQQPPSIGWAPFLEPYIELSGDERARKFLLEFADTVLKRGHHYYGDARALATAYRLTGNRDYLIKGWAHLNAGPRLYDWDGDPLRGYVDWLPYSYITQQSLYLLGAMRSLEPMPRFEEIPYTGGGPTAPLRLPKEQSQTLTLLFPEESDTTFHVGGRFFSYSDVDYRWISPDGKVLREGTITRPAEDTYRFEFDQPADAQTGTYRLELTASLPFGFWTSAISSLGTQRFEVPSSEAGRALGMHGGGGRWYFWVPADCEEFKLRVIPYPDPRVRSVVEVITPDDQPYKRLSLPYPGDERMLAVEPPRRFRGKVWALAAEQLALRAVEGIPNWFAATIEGAKP